MAAYIPAMNVLFPLKKVFAFDTKAEQAWDNMYASRYGFWRTYVMTVIYRYLDCGDLHMGFARVRCENCGHEYLSKVPYICRSRGFSLTRARLSAMEKL